VLNKVFSLIGREGEGKFGLSNEADWVFVQVFFFFRFSFYLEPVFYETCEVYDLGSFYEL
jgi:hypothetical protein